VLSGIVTTIAGSGPSGRLLGGYSGDNGPATSARLNAPEDVAVDPSGNIFIADSLNGAVRRIDAKSRNITTIFSTNDRYVSGVALDSSGNLFVTGFRLWKVRADGQISEIAGGGVDITDDIPGSLANLNLALGLTIDNKGNIFFAERFGGSVRVIRGPVPSTAAAQPTVTSIVPSSGVQGATISATSSGKDLSGATAVACSGGGRPSKSSLEAHQQTCRLRSRSQPMQLPERDLAR
jgi:WD40 repeat protein